MSLGTGDEVLSVEATATKSKTNARTTTNTTTKPTSTKPATKAKANDRRFTCFPSLPPEIRLQIWREACFIPRFVDIWSVYKGNFSIGRNTHQCCQYKSACPAPGVLQTSRESRDVALKYYECAFGTAHEMQYGFWLTTEAKIWVNWEVDCVVPVEERKWTAETLEDFFLKNEKVKRVACSIGDVGEGLLFHDLSRMPLKEVVLYRQELGAGLGDGGNRGIEQWRRFDGVEKLDFVGVERGTVGSSGRHWWEQLMEAKRCVEERYEEYIEDEEYKALVPVKPRIRCMKMVVNGCGKRDVSRLPIELRLEIWKCACFTPRVVDVLTKAIGRPIFPDSRDERNLFAYVTRTPTPSVLHANRESRMEAPKYYKLDFGLPNFENHRATITIPPRIYVNFASDWIVPLGVYAEDAQLDFCKRPIHHLVWATDHPSIYDHGPFDWSRDFDRETMMTQSKEYDGYYGDDMVESYPVRGFDELNGVEFLRVDDIALIPLVCPSPPWELKPYRFRVTQKHKQTSLGVHIVEEKKSLTEFVRKREKDIRREEHKHKTQIQTFRESGGKGYPPNVAKDMMDRGLSDRPWVRPNIHLMCISETSKTTEKNKIGDKN